MAISKKEEHPIEQEPQYENTQTNTSNENQNGNGNHPRSFKKRKKFDGWYNHYPITAASGIEIFGDDELSV